MTARRRTDAELFAALSALFDEIELDDAEVDDILRSAGYDPYLVSKEIQEIVEEALAERRGDKT